MRLCRSTLLTGFSLGFVFSLAFAQASHDVASNAQLASPEIEQKVDILLKRMTFDEKIGQLVQYSARVREENCIVSCRYTAVQSARSK